MSIYIFTKKEAPLKAAFGKNVEFLSAMPKQCPGDSDIAYFDVSGLSAADINKALSQLKKFCKDVPWGIIDLKGSVKDPAVLFFEGASDYMGPELFKGSKKIDPKRLKPASGWRSLLAGSGTAKTDAKTSGGAKFVLPKTGIKFPAASIFPGWKNIQTGKTMPFYLLYCSIQGKTALTSRMGEKDYAQMHQRLLGYLYQNLLEGDGLAWMDSGKDCVFLLPPRQKCVEAGVKACLRMLPSSPLVVTELLGLGVQANFVFALHYGSVSYKPPGKTGTVVSDAINFIFHLGAKKAEPGRLTISDELPDGSIPQTLEDSFLSAGEYEGRKIWHTKKFSYVRPWL